MYARHFLFLISLSFFFLITFTFRVTHTLQQTDVTHISNINKRFLNVLNDNCYFGNVCFFLLIIDNLFLLLSLNIFDNYSLFKYALKEIILWKSEEESLGLVFNLTWYTSTLSNWTSEVASNRCFWIKIAHPTGGVYPTSHSMPVSCLHFMMQNKYAQLLIVNANSSFARFYNFQW